MTERQNKYSIYPDEELMLYLSKGEVLAFDELYERYSRRLMVYFVRMLNFNQNLAEDALQDLFLKLAESPEKFDRSRSFKTWIFSLASNSCKNFYRHQRVVKQSNDELEYLHSQHIDTSYLTQACKLDAIEFQKMLHDVLNELSHEKKEAFLLRYQEEKSLSEIAEIQNCPLGSVKSRLHYTLKVLEERLYQFNPVS